jgi:hypothetical protein
MHARIHTYIHTYMQTYIHTYTHIKYNEVSVLGYSAYFQFAESPVVWYIKLYTF